MAAKPATADAAQQIIRRAVVASCLAASIGGRGEAGTLERGDHVRLAGRPARR